ncbi:DUF418 domain-containing protein [Streptosporangium carneum]|uniref:DUF418 domain-containing protein n=1 Tax=Streptosporangium carneum TaxID=47481 RepID=A0A9W6MFU4_9ACTN|nr:DUF418 domain-containing protein [Streptosporangium carneum]GLK12626.1 hypothetical protein GCM10017600_60360 [Streptosporangium carneum]
MPHEELPPELKDEDPTRRHGGRRPGRPRPDEGREAPATTSPGRPRVDALDVLRGFALCGILLANVRPISNLGGVVVSESAGGAAEAWMGLLVEQRFFPIFSLLFGVGFSLLLDSAAGRAVNPRLLLLRRLLVLLAVGAAHFLLLWRGDILTTYAVVGLLVLLPSTWLPRWAVAGLAAALVAASLIAGGDRTVLVAGLFLLGSALARYGVTDRIERSARGPVVVGLVLAAGAAAALWSRVDDVRDPGFGLSLALTGLLLAGVYVCALLVLLRTPLRPALRAVFLPLGRMALTNYLTATVVVLAAAHLHGRPQNWSWATVFSIAAAVLAAQWLFSTLWLRRFRQGPLEWLWRWATWGRRPPLRVS